MTINFRFYIAELEKFEANAIRAVVNGELLAVRIQEWCPEVTRAYALNNLADISGVGYADEPGFKQFIARAAYDFRGPPERLDEYLDAAPLWFARCRKVFGPYVSPFDKLWLELQLWPHGCTLQKFMDRAAFAGLVRAFEVGGEARIHQDMPHWDFPHVPEAQGIKKLLSAVNYLGCANRGGFLELWNFGIADQAEYDRCKVPNDYGIDRKIVGEPTVVLAPRPGETIIFNPQNLHSVTRNESGKRSTQSTFIVYRGLNAPTSLFS